MLSLWAAVALAVSPVVALAAPSGTPEPSDQEIRRRAEAGDADAQNDLGVRLIATNDQARLAEAREWLRRASESGHLDATSNYAGMLLIGAGGPADPPAARRLLDQAAALGSVGAHLTIAARYLAGADGYPRDPARAFAHVRAAAESDQQTADLAQWRLGMMYLEGVGTPANAEEAYRWVVRASENGGVRGMISRAVMLATGQGVAEDDQAARLWYRRAAESGDVMFPHGIRGLGWMLATGEGGPVDLPRGVAYLRIAQAGNDPNARQLLETLADRITPDVDRQAWAISRQWMREHMQADAGDGS